MSNSATQAAPVGFQTSRSKAEAQNGRRNKSLTKKLTIRNLAPSGLSYRGVSSVVSDKYLPWGPDNQYPQHVLKAVAASGTAAACVALKAKFIEGNGFRDTTFYKSVINRKQQTVDQLVRLHCRDISKLEGVCALINFNAAGYPCEVFFTNFAQWRPGVPDDDGVTRTDYIIQNTNLLKKTNSLGKTSARKYNRYNPNEKPADRIARIEKDLANREKPVPFTEYEGELAVYFHTDSGALNHPRPGYDNVMRDILSEAALKVSRHVDIRNGFASQVMVTEYGTTDPDDEKLEADEEKYGDMIGEDAARVVIQYAQDKQTKPDVDELPAPNASERYATDENAIRRNIRAAFFIPTILYGEEVAGKLGTAQEFEDALNYVQQLVVNSDQRAIEDFYKSIFTDFQPLNSETSAAHINPSSDYSLENLTLKPAASIPTAAEKTSKAIATLLPLVANRVLSSMSDREIRELVGLGPLAAGEVPSGAQPLPAQNGV